MSVLFSLREVIRRHNRLENEQILLNASYSYEDFAIRKTIEEHQTSFYKFLLRYEEIKVDIIFLILGEMEQKIRYNISKWRKNFSEKISFYDLVHCYFSFSNFENFMVKEADESLFLHDLKISQISIQIMNGEDLMGDVKSSSLNLVQNLVGKMVEYMRERYESIFDCEKKLEKIVMGMVGRNVVSERESVIAKEVLKRINIYCFP